MKDPNEAIVEDQYAKYEARIAELETLLERWRDEAYASGNTADFGWPKLIADTNSVLMDSAT